ncbi:MAG TPA: PEP-CTERM system TPR-repeat protein PrsT [Thiobacillaceae bacterium]|nr:PEP-CTERM system TPR-repeat protein PrsT [Thiobacillaceae bacterium]HNU63750.1 PEP-CTERM system TPR-repeat protein PrsT [Thiobacillaceae bacterium]
MLKRTLTPLALALALTQWGCSDGGQQARQHLDQAQSLSRTGDLKGAIIEYKNAIQQEPGNAEARFALAGLYLRQGMGGSAEKELLQARQLGMDEDQVAPSLGEALLLNGDYKRVLELLNPAAAKALSTRADLVRMHADAQLGLGQIDVGCAQYQEALRLDANLAAAYWGLARCARMREGPEAARVQFEKALALDPKNARTRVEFGNMEYGLGNLAEAERQYAEAARLDADSVPARTGQALTRFLQGQVEPARVESERLLREYPDSPLVKSLQAILAYGKNDFATARQAAAAALKELPDHLPSLVVHGRAAAKLGDYEAAWRSLSRYHLAHPEDAHIRRLLANALIQVRRNRDALEVLAPLIKEDSRDTTALLLAASAHQHDNKPDLTRKFLQRALAADPRSADAHMAMAQALLAAQEYAAAQTHLQLAVQYAPDNLQARYALVRAQLAMQESESALSQLADIAKRWPGQGETAALQAQALLDKKDLAGARRVLEARLQAVPKDTAAALNLARVDLAENRPAEAGKRVQAVLAQHPKHLEAQLLRSRIAGLQGNAKERLVGLEEVIKDHPTALAPRMELSRYLLSQGQAYKALEQARQAEKLRPGAADVLALLADVQLAAGEKDNALASAQRLATIALPNSAPVQLQYARLLLAINDNRQEARYALGRALGLQPDYLDAQIELVALDLAERKYNAALETARKVQARRPGDATGHIFEGDVMRAQNRYSAAADAYRKGIDKQGGGTAMVSLHNALVLAGRQAEADKALADWLARHPTDIPVRIYRAEAAMTGARPDQAIAFFEEIQGLRPGLPAVLNNLALLYARQGDGRALDLARRARAGAPENPHIADTLGWLLLQADQPAEALSLLRQAHQALPDQPQVAYHLAAALHRTGAQNDARALLRKLLDSGTQAFPERPQAEALRKRLGD